MRSVLRGGCAVPNKMRMGSNLRPPIFRDVLLIYCEILDRRMLS